MDGFDALLTLVILCAIFLGGAGWRQRAKSRDRDRPADNWLGEGNTR